MGTAETTIVAGGVPYEVSDKQQAGEGWNDFVNRHLQRIRLFITTLGDEVGEVRDTKLTR